MGKRGMLLPAFATAIIAGLVPGSALAAVAYTGDGVAGQTTATVYGYVDPQGEGTYWGFAYGTTTGYGAYSKFGSVPSSASEQLVAAQLTGLQAGVTYHYVLFAIPVDSSGQPDWAHASAGQDMTISTTRGNVNLASSRLAVRHGAMLIPVQCASTLACNGSISVSTKTRSGRSTKTVSCGSASVKLAPGAHSTASRTLSSGCAWLLKSARGHRLTATATGSFSTGQTPPSETVTLVG